jgi:putative heme-binding domain-containing protein
MTALKTMNAEKPSWRMVGCFVLLSIARCATAQAPSPASVDAGKRLFAVSCSVGYCHGAEGRAGRGPRLRDREWDRTYLFKVIDEGIPNSSMPAWRGKLSEDQMRSVVAYILSISKEIVQTGSSPQPPPEAATRQTAASPLSKAGVMGDPMKGKDLFFDAANDRNCGVCHKVGGAGGDVGPDLSRIADLPAREILHRIVLSPSPNPAPNPAIELVMKDGETVRGILAGEKASGLRVYDLTSPGPPVLRSFDVADVAARRSIGLDIAHENFAAAYTVKQWLDIVSYVKAPAQVSLGDLF